MFDTFFSSMKHKRVLVYGGVMNDLASAYDDDELDEWKVKDDADYVFMLMAKFNFDSMQYEKRYRDLTFEEKKEISGFI